MKNALKTFTNQIENNPKDGVVAPKPWGVGGADHSIK
jgi:hypothetical protein